MYRFAALTLFLSALVHISTLVISGLLSDSVLVVTYISLGVVFLVLSALLLRKYRWSAWISFLILLFSVALDLSGLNSFMVPNAVIYVMASLDISAFLILFIILWRHGNQH